MDPAVYEKEEHKFDFDGRDSRFPKTVAVPEGAHFIFRFLRPCPASLLALVNFMGGVRPWHHICCWSLQAARASPSQTTQASCGTRCPSRATAGEEQSHLQRLLIVNNSISYVV